MALYNHSKFQMGLFAGIIVTLGAIAAIAAIDGGDPGERIMQCFGEVTKKVR